MTRFWSSSMIARTSRARALLSATLFAVLFAIGTVGCGGGSSVGESDTQGDDVGTDDVSTGDLVEDVTPPDGGEADTPTGDVTAAGQVVVITEFIPNPCVVTDGDGEWVELTNISTESVDINGWTLQDDGNDKHVITNVGPLVIEPGLSIVLGSNADDTANGGVPVDYAYSGFTLKNSGDDQIVLVDASGAIVDAVAYDATWLAEIPDGCASLQLTPDAYTAEQNDSLASWCAAVSPYGTGDNMGTPGGANARCVEVNCGNGAVEPEFGEECDLGPDNSDTAPDTCRENCKEPWCGDGVTDTGRGEACDDGDANSDTTPDACRETCVAPTCGDGITDPANGEACDDGPDGSETCTANCRPVGEPAPEAHGDLFFTEIMRNSADSQDLGEWVELFNPTQTTFSLEGCLLKDDSDHVHTIEGVLLIVPGQHLVLARSDDAIDTGGLVSDYVYSSVRLGNSAGEVVLDCFGTVIDTVAYSDVAGWPDDAAYSMSLARGAYDATSNDDPANWCSAADTDVYGDETNHGTPGAENPACGETEPVDWCRLQPPATLEAQAGAELTVYGRVREAGITDVTPGIDPSDLLKGQVGYGPDGSDPAAGGGWTWRNAQPNAEWDGTAAGEVDNDEYVAVFAAPAPGTYDVAYRFSADGGASWTVCDLDASDNGYDAAQSIALTSTDSICFPNPCSEIPPATCEDDGVTRLTYAGPGTCTPTGADTFDCDFPETAFDCGLIGATCDAGACVGGAREAAAGEIVITEVMRNAEGNDDGKEWIELHNTTAEWLSIEGCTVTDDAGNAGTLTAEPQAVIAPGAYVVLGQNADAATNGGVDVDYVYGLALSLGNTSDHVVLTCGEANPDRLEIDRIQYDNAAGWPQASGAAMSLDPDAMDAAENDDPTNWCDASEPYGDATNLGSPGVENPPCTGDVVVDWCRLQWPLTLEAPAGTSFVAYGHVYDQGITDLTTGVDAFDGLVGQAGVGPDGSDPAAAPETWTWFDAVGNPAWDGAAADEPNNDEYLTDVAVPSAGAYDFAYRFSLDNGTTWLYCDGGDAGSSDGYAPENAGALTATASPCETTVCDTADPPECQDAAILVVYEAPGTCSVEAGQAVCTYPSDTVDCTIGGGTCQDGACVGGARPPAVGEVIFTEAFYDATGALNEAAAEWFELTNVTTDDLILHGCTVTDLAANSVTIDGLVVAAGDTALFVRSADTAANGGLVPDHLFGFGLNNTNETLTLGCAAGTIDAIAYDEGAGWPVAAGASIALDPGAYDAAANDDAANWCLGLDVYFAGATEADNQFGSPDAENPACPLPDTTIDWCRLQWPLAETVLAGTDLTIFGRVWDEGVTDQSTGNDPDPLLVGQAGFGPDGSDPSTDDTGWTWIDATPNPSWDGTVDAEPENDEYMATFTAPSAGTYDHAYRFSLDAGATWLYCDTNAGPGSDGAEDGYQVANAGALVTQPSPCDPNPCVDPGDDTCDVDGVTVIDYSGEPGTCAVDGMEAVCSFPFVTVDCSQAGGVCDGGECVGGARPPLPGEVVITEIMYDVDPPLTEGDAEWVELYNTTADDLALSGCTLADSNLSPDALDTFVIPAGAFVLLGHDVDPLANGGIDIVATFGFGLNNGGDDVILTCGETIDAVSYDGGPIFPDLVRYAISLDPGLFDAASNDDGGNWCLAADTDIYFAGAAETERHYGTPGAMNPPCPVIDTTIDWCRLQWPLDEEVLAGTNLAVYGRVWEEGLTDLTTGVDVAPQLVAQAGVGPDGSDPSVDDTGWTWVDASPNPGWDGATAGEPNNDEYLATFPAPAVGVYDHAYRFSLDDGATWLYCDRDAGAGSDGAEDGYQAANAGGLTTLASPCDPNPCTTIPDDACDPDGVTRIAYTGADGTCAVDGVDAACTYPFETVDCSATGATCSAGACVGGARPPVAGELVISEIMFDTSTPLEESNAEWLELYNTTGDDLLLAGCTLTDAAPSTTNLATFIVPAGGYALLGRKSDTAINGGITVDATFTLSLNNTSETVTFACGDVIDTVSYGAGVGFPSQARHAISLDPASHDATANDDGANWCLAAETDVYFAGASDTQRHFGTPGAANPACPVIDTEVDWCRLQWPLDAEVLAGTAVAVYGRVYDEGLTDQTSGVDVDPMLVGQAGYGPDGSDPSVDDTGWSWVAATPNPTWNGSAVGEAENDEYQAAFPAPTAGTYDHAFRFSLDGGTTWLYCDRDAGAGADGSENGYQPASAGALTSVASPCEPNPCTVPDPPACDPDGITRITYALPGTCAVDAMLAVCTYATETTDCSTNGGTCADGACVGGAQPPAAGDLVISEIMFDTNAPLSESAAEWIELYNAAATPLLLDGCTIGDAGGGTATLAGLIVDAGEHLLLARSPVAASNGGLVPDATFGFSLNNPGDTITVTCGGATIDAVTYGAGFPLVGRFAIALDAGAHDATANDDAANWCLALVSDVYFAGAAPAEAHYGTPGAANPACPEEDIVVDWCRLQFPLDVEVEAGTEVTVYGRLYDEGLTDRTTGIDFDPFLVGAAGFGPDGSDPSVGGAGWTWAPATANPTWDGAAVGEHNNDEYQATFPAPLAGTFDLAFRFSLDGGTTWLYCDRNAGDGSDGSEDGYQPANAGSLSTTDACTPNPCTVAPDAECQADGVTLVTYVAPGTCTLDGDSYACSFGTEEVDCSIEGQICANGACAAGGDAPTTGDLVISEILYDTSTPLAEGAAEWIEIYNASARNLTLDGCTIGDAGGGSAPLDGIAVVADGFVLLARSADTATNGGLEVAGTFGFGLNNSSGDVITITCATGVIDVVDYGALGFPDPVRYSIALDPDAHDAVSNDSGLNWCQAAETDVYFVGAGGAEQHYGTPGVANPDCPVQDSVVDWCRYQHPLDAAVVEGSVLTVYGRVYDQDLTDATTGVDFHPALVAQAGFGPDGSNPAVDDTGWAWIEATANADWVDTADPNNDEYMANVTAPAPGTYDLAYRFSLDFGQTWLYCDSDGANTNADYAAANAGNLVTSDDVCLPNPCTSPDAPSCDVDGVTLVTPVSPGACTDNAGVAACDYSAVETTDCSLTGAVCADGLCVGGAGTPGEGDLVITEIVYDTEAPLSDSNAEWFEVYNATAEDLTLAGCVLSDSSTTSTTLGPVTIEAGAYAVFAASDVAADNGGLAPLAVFDFGLNNGGDEITITCAGTVVDTVTYDDGGAFPNAVAMSISLAPLDLDAASNDDGANWCLPRPRYFDDGVEGPGGDHFGTPGAANPPCDSTVDWCRLQHPVDETGVTAGTPLTVYGRLYEAGVTDVSGATDEHPIVWGSVGVGPDGSDPTVDDTGWTWTPAEPNPGWDGPANDEADNDEYQAIVPAPSAGTYDVAYRFSLDGGRSWTHCDRGPEGTSNGYAPADAGNLVTVAAATQPLFFSEYIEGSSNNKAVEIYNAGDGPVLLSSCALLVYSAGGVASTSSVTLAPVELAAGEVFVLCHTSFALGVPADLCDQFGSLFYNGDDALELNCQGTTMDIIGQTIGVDPGSAWIGSGAGASTANDTIVRNCDVTVGDTDGSDAFDPDLEWTSLDTDNISDLGVRCAN